MQDIFIIYDVNKAEIVDNMDNVLAFIQYPRNKYLEIRSLTEDMCVKLSSSGGGFGKNFVFNDHTGRVLYSFNNGSFRIQFYDEQGILYQMLRHKYSKYMLYDAEGRLLTEIEWSFFTFNKRRGRIRIHNESLDQAHLYAFIILAYRQFSMQQIFIFLAFAYVALFLIKLLVIDIYLPLVFGIIDKILS